MQSPGVQICRDDVYVSVLMVQDARCIRVPACFLTTCPGKRAKLEHAPQNACSTAPASEQSPVGGPRR